MTTTRGLSRPQATGLTSALLAGIGGLLSGVLDETLGWGGPGDAGAGGEALAILTLLFAVLAVGLVVLGLFESREPVSIVGYGLLIVGIGSWQVLIVGGGAAPGVGPTLTLVGGTGLLVAGLWGYRSEGRLERGQRRVRTH